MNISTIQTGFDTWYVNLLVCTSGCLHVSPNEILGLGQLRSLWWLFGSHGIEMQKRQTVSHWSVKKPTVRLVPVSKRLKVAQAPG